MYPILDFICDMLGRGTPVILARITSQRGSTPRSAGTLMAVNADGAIAGTIGGGLLEGRATAQSLELLKNGGSRWISFDLSAVDVAAMDMMCGGALSVLLDHLRPDEETLAVFNRWRQALIREENGFLLTLFCGDEKGDGATRHALVLDDGTRYGQTDLPQDALARLVRSLRQADTLQIVDMDGQRVVIEPARKPDALFIFGAGHVALPTARLAALVGFRVEVLDDRAEFANRQRFPEVRAVHVLTDFDLALQELSVDAQSSLVILTRGHLYDRTVLAQALRTPARYIGMIGSRRKRDALYASLLSDGFSTRDLQRVHSPVGLNIGAESPEEIAVSIVAELIQERSWSRS